MTGTITATIEHVPGGQVITIDWKSDASGDGLANLDTELGVGKLTGEVAFFETAPGENGDLTTDLPTASYDLFLVDAHGFDWANGEIDDRSGTVAEKVVPTNTIIFLNQVVSIKVDNAGDANRGRLVIGLRNLFGR